MVVKRRAKLSFSTTSVITHLLAITTLSASSVAATLTDCYFPDGSIAPDFVRCPGSNSKACCLAGSTCLSGDFEGLCEGIVPGGGASAVYRGACKARFWDLDGCSNVCKELVPNDVEFLPKCSDYTSCCSSTPLNAECCEDRESLVTLERKVPDYDADEKTTARGGYGTKTPETETVPTTQTTTTTAETTTTVAAGLDSDGDAIAEESAKKYVAIGAGLGVGGACIIVAAVVLVCWHVKRKKRALAAATAVSDGEKALTDAEAGGASGAPPSPRDPSSGNTSALGSPVEVSQSLDFSSSGGCYGSNAAVGVASMRGDGENGNVNGSGGYPAGPPDLEVSPMPPAPPYSPPQYDAGEYQYLVVDGPMHVGAQPGSGGGLPVGEDGKPRLAD